MLHCWRRNLVVKLIPFNLGIICQNIVAFWPNLVGNRPWQNMDIIRSSTMSFTLYGSLRGRPNFYWNDAHWLLTFRINSGCSQFNKTCTDLIYVRLLYLSTITIGTSSLLRLIQLLWRYDRLARSSLPILVIARTSKWLLLRILPWLSLCRWKIFWITDLVSLVTPLCNHLI